MQYMKYDGRPSDTEGRQPRELRVYDLLDRLGIAYERVDHEPVATMEDCAEIDRILDAVVCKNLFLCNRQKTKFYLLLIRDGKQFHTKELSEQLGIARLSFGDLAKMEELLDLHPGAVSVLGLMNDRAKQVQLLVDTEVRDSELFGCHPCVNTSSLRFATADLFGKILPEIGHAPIFVTIGS